MDKELLKRYFANQVSNEEAKRVENWLFNSGNKEEILEYISTSYISESNEMPARPFQEVLDKIKTKRAIPAKVVVLKRKWFWAASAACVLFLLLGGWLGFHFNNSSNFASEWAINTAQTESGQYAQVTLSDGSEVYLSGNSKIYFPDEMNVHPVVYLEGEAYFDLQNEKLTIKTRDLVTTAKNSKLNISAFLKDSLVTVTVEKGKAEVRNNNTNDVFPMLKLRFPKEDSVAIKRKKIIPWAEIKPALTIKENEQATYDKGTKTTDVSEVKPGTIPMMKLQPAKTMRVPNETTVANGLNFYKADITEIIYKLELKYGVKVTINIEGKTLPKYSGKFDENAIISDVLNSICKALGLQYQVSENLIKITELK
jgi:hypothetical protein